MPRIATLDNKDLQFHAAGPNMRLFLLGPKGGYYGSCILDLQDMKDISVILRNHIDKMARSK